MQDRLPSRKGWTASFLSVESVLIHRLGLNLAGLLKYSGLWCRAYSEMPISTCTIQNLDQGLEKCGNALTPAGT